MNLFSLFEKSSETYPGNTALVVDNTTYSYSDLREKAGKISSLLMQFETKQVGILAYRSVTAYAGILATLQSGKTYVPLNPKFPISRTETTIVLSGAKALIVDNSCVETMKSLSRNFKEPLVLIFPETAFSDIPEEIRNNHRVYSKENLKTYSVVTVSVKENDFAYIMFTSGSTGIPKGVPVSHANVLAYIDYMDKKYSIRTTDRFSQTFDITFDLSVHDLFLSWKGGASLYCIPENILMAPAKFIRENKLTMWFSVPSLAQFMNKFRMLKVESFPDLRYSLFCGEPLPKSIAVAWQKAAQNSVIENIYGPTETTIGITHYTLPENEQDIKELNGIVSIGNVFASQYYCLINEYNEITENEGELCLAGPQVTSGYWNNEEKTKEQFVSLKNSARTWYKTGDIVKEKNKLLYYVTRNDFQVKIRGYRIELDEINNAIVKITGANIVCSIPFPVNDGIADNIYSFIDSPMEKKTLLADLKNVLPEYMIPKDVIFINKFPLNSNGKIDRKELLNYINQKT